MPNTRPGIIFNNEGVCSACITEKKKDLIDWESRKKELEKLCDKYRGMHDDGYDCLIAVSGGKDSHFQVHIIKELMGMNPLLVTVEDNFTLTEAGKNNIKNISKEFGCDIISFKPNGKIQKPIMKYTFEKYLKPTYFIDVLIYSYPLHMAIKWDLPLVIYGENVNYEYGGVQIEEIPSALEQIFNGVASGIPIEEFLTLDGVTKKDITMLTYPTIEEMKGAKLDPIYLSYFYKWNGYANYIFAKSRGFKDLSKEWRRSHHMEDYSQVDSIAYLVHSWCKYPKFGHQHATDIASRQIKTGLISREEGIEMVKKYDHNLDQRCVDDFCAFTGYSRSEFWSIIDRFYNKDLFKKDKHGRWVLKNPIWEQL